MLIELGFTKTAVVGSKVLKAAINHARATDLPIYRTTNDFVAKEILEPKLVKEAPYIPKVIANIMDRFTKGFVAFSPEIPKHKMRAAVVLDRSAFKRPHVVKAKVTPGNALLHEMGHAQDALEGGFAPRKWRNNPWQMLMEQELAADRNAVKFIKKNESPELLDASLKSFRDGTRQALNTYRSSAVRSINKSNKIKEKGQIMGRWHARRHHPTLSEVKDILRKNPILRETY